MISANKHHLTGLTVNRLKELCEFAMSPLLALLAKENGIRNLGASGKAIHHGRNWFKKFSLQLFPSHHMHFIHGKEFKHN
jgi:hypothetical protein